MTEEKHLTTEMVRKYQKVFHTREDAEVIARAIQKNGIKTGKPSNQRHSGRCWSFATLNTMRHKFAKKYNFKDFELSQNYLFFWDRIERANMYLSLIHI